MNLNDRIAFSTYINWTRT